MFLKEFTVTDLQRKGKEVCDTAKREAVLIRRQANTDLVMMSRDEYQRLIKGGK